MESSRVEQFGKDIAGAYKDIATLKWSNDFLCSACGHQDWFEGKFPYSRRCAKCKKDFSPTAGTIFHGVRFPLNIAIYIIKRVAAKKERITSEELTEEISAKFKQNLRQKTVWAFLMKVYNAMIFPAPKFTTYINIIRFNHGGKVIIGLQGFVHGKMTTVVHVRDKDGNEILTEAIGMCRRNNTRLVANDATFKKVHYSPYPHQRQQMITTELKPIFSTGEKDDGDVVFPLSLYETIAGVNATHFQAYLNFYCYHANKYTYGQLMNVLIPRP